MSEKLGYIYNGLGRMETDNDSIDVYSLIQAGVVEGQLLPRTLSEVQSLDDVIVWREKGRIVGCVSLEIYSQRLAEIRSLYVYKPYREEGIGTKLIESCVEKARQKGVNELIAITDKIDLFEKVGFNDPLHNQRAVFMKL